MNHCIELSTKNFEEASKIYGQRDFCFIVGEHKIYCHPFVASFISRKVNRNLLSDPTMNTFNIQFGLNDTKFMYEEDIISFIQKLIKGQPIEINDEKIKKMKEEIQNIAKSRNSKDYFNTMLSSYLFLINELENEEIEQQFFAILFSKQANSQNKSDSKEDINQKLQKLEEIEEFIKISEQMSGRKSLNTVNKEKITKIISDYFNEKYTAFIDQISSHFYEIDDEIIIKMNSCILSDILINDNLKIKDEDSLLNILLKRRTNHVQGQKNSYEEEDEEFFIEKVNFEFLSEKGIEMFLNEIPFSELNEELWASICRRLVLPVQVKGTNKRSQIKTPQIQATFSYDANNVFNGILNHLNEITNGNIQENKTIEITCSHFCCGSVESIVDFKNSADTYAHVTGDSPRWAKFDFKNRKIQIDSYLIKGSTRSDPIKSFAVEISDDGSNWEKIDEQNDVSELRNGNRMKLFKIQMTKPFRFIKIDVKESVSGGGDFDIGRFELYGNLF